jgi:hypothetical protein
LDSMELASKIFLAEYPSLNGDDPSMGPWTIAQICPKYAIKNWSQ